MNSTDQFNKVRMTISVLNAFKSKNLEADNRIDKHICVSPQCEDQLQQSIDKVAEAQIPHGNQLSQKRDSKDIKKLVELPALQIVDKLQVTRGRSWLKLRSALGNQNNKNNNKVKRRTSKSNKSLGKTQEQENLPSNTLSFLDEEDARSKKEYVTEENYKPVFVEIANLTKGDTFGVNFMLFENQPSVCLVSNGAECIVISKKFYLNYCTEAMKRTLLLEEQPFPDDKTLQKNLQDKINWESFKMKTLHNTLNNLPPSCRAMLTEKEN